jgi:hypothetical protein
MGSTRYDEIGRIVTVPDNPTYLAVCLTGEHRDKCGRKRCACPCHTPEHLALVDALQVFYKKHILMPRPVDMALYFTLELQRRGCRLTMQTDTDAE